MISPTTTCLKIRFFLNTDPSETIIWPWERAIDVIREKFGLKGTKESCSEGDCGACTIALGKIEKEQLIYRAINSCILPAAKMHGTHVITIEGLAADDRLHLIQQKMIDHHAIQCGFCTPGMIMSLFCLFSRLRTPQKEDILAALEGNLCRCTGYKQIVEAAEDIASILAESSKIWKKLLFPSYIANVQKALAKKRPIEFEQKALDKNRLLSYEFPKTLKEAFSKKYKEKTAFIAGGTDLMIAVNENKIKVSHLIDISNVAELHKIEDKKTSILVGAGVTLSELLENSLIAKKIPILKQVISKMASTQVRNSATLAGNIANASPVGDASCVLLALGAKLHLRSSKGKRIIALEQFFKGYKITDLWPNELIAYIEIPVLRGIFSFEKSSKRNAVDIATVSSCCYLEIDKEKIINCRLAFGGVAPYPKLAGEVMNYMMGKTIDEKTIKEMARRVVSEFTPLTDVRGGRDFRRQLIQNHIIKHVYQAK